MCHSCAEHESHLGDIIDQIENFDGQLKIHLFPEAKNQILVRLENIADLFDGSPASTPFFDLKKYVVQLYAMTNGGEMPDGVTLTERTLGNN